jgi:eukaryotic-like serine/threonine-protein kinase
MNRGRHEKIDEIFQAAVDLPPRRRDVFLEEACEGDPELRAEVESLLSAHEEAGDFIEGSASDVAASLLEKDGRRPAQLRQYKIERLLGVGGMGEVFLAHDTRLNRSVALKLLSTHLTGDEERVRRFRQEALAASALNHPNILTIHEIEEGGERPYIATEFVKGVTLRGLMRGKRLSLADALDIALQVGGALSAAHEAGIVHRDIKPENIMVRPDGLVKILDFGIATYAAPSRPRDSKEVWIRTATGVIIGTAAYMSPEQARGAPVDARTDVWSLGVTLYEMVAGRLPFMGATPTDRVAAILEREPVLLSRLRRGVPPALEKIIRRALAKERDERYARAADMVGDLRELRATLGGERQRSFSLPRLAQGIPGLSNRRAAALLASLVAVAAVVLAAYLMSGAGRRGVNRQGAAASGSAAAESLAVESLAVLPLVNVGGGADAEYLSDGVTESLINNLSQLPNLRVMSRNSVFRYKGKEVDAAAVADALRVQAVLTGRLWQRGDELSVSVELVDARDNAHLWGGQYSRKLKDLVSLQGEIARDVSRKLRAHLSGADEQRLAKNYTENSEAYQLYLKGRYHVLTARHAGAETGISYFRQAITIDPTYALAYAGIAEASTGLAFGSEMPSAEVFPRAREAAQKAVEIDGQLAEAYVALGWVSLFYDWDWRASEDHVRRALELNANNADAHLAYGMLLCDTGRRDEGITELRRAVELDPLNLRNNAVEGEYLHFVGQTDEALARFQKTFELEPNFYLAHLFASSAYADKGMFPEAVAEGRTARRLNPVGSVPVVFLGYALAKSGDRAEARALLAQLLKASNERYISPYNVALLYIGLGERDEALEWLERGIDQRDLRMTFLNVEPKWNNLRSDPRFADLLRRMNLTP